MVKLHIFCLFLMSLMIAIPCHAADQNTTDEVLFLDFLGILADFTKILFDPENIPNVQKNVASIVTKIVHAAHTVIRKPLSPEKRELLVRLVRLQCMRIRARLQEEYAKNGLQA
jgi:hypothetical protein